jgi:hypothetical protein
MQSKNAFFHKHDVIESYGIIFLKSIKNDLGPFKEFQTGISFFYYIY